MTENQAEKARQETIQTETYADNLTIPIIEEKVVFGKKIVETGKVRISKRVSEHEEIVDEPLFREQVSVERQAVNQFIDQPAVIRQEGDTMIIPVVEERLVVEKKLFLVEELHVKKQLLESSDPQKITLRKEEINVNRLNEAENSKG